MRDRQVVLLLTKTLTILRDRQVVPFGYKPNCPFWETNMLLFCPNKQVALFEGETSSSFWGTNKLLFFIGRQVAPQVLGDDKLFLLGYKLFFQRKWCCSFPLTNELHFLRNKQVAPFIDKQVDLLEGQTSGFFWGTNQVALFEWQHKVAIFEGQTGCSFWGTNFQVPLFHFVIDKIPFLRAGTNKCHLWGRDKLPF